MLKNRKALIALAESLDGQGSAYGSLVAALYDFAEDADGHEVYAFIEQAREAFAPEAK